MKTDNLFLNFELLLLWEKLSNCSGVTKNGGTRKIVVLKSEVDGDYMIWGGFKVCKKHGDVIVKDMDYGFMNQARRVTNERYLKRLCDFVASTEKGELHKNRGNPGYVKNAIRGICRFGDNLSEHITEEKNMNIKKDLHSLSVLEVAAKYNLSEHYVKKLKNEKA